MEKVEDVFEGWSSLTLARGLRIISSVAMSCATLALPPSESGRSRAQCVTYDRRSLAASERKDAFRVRERGAKKREDAHDNGRSTESRRKIREKNARQYEKWDHECIYV